MPPFGDTHYISKGDLSDFEIGRTTLVCWSAKSCDNGSVASCAFSNLKSTDLLSQPSARRWRSERFEADREARMHAKQQRDRQRAAKKQ